MPSWAGKPLNYHSQPVAFAQDVEGKHIWRPIPLPNATKTVVWETQRLPRVLLYRFQQGDQPIASVPDVEGKQYLAPDPSAKRDENSRLGIQRLPRVAGDSRYCFIGAGTPLNYHSQPIAFAPNVEEEQARYLCQTRRNSRLGIQRLPRVAGDPGHCLIDFSSMKAAAWHKAPQKNHWSKSSRCSGGSILRCVPSVSRGYCFIDISSPAPA